MENITRPVDGTNLYVGPPEEPNRYRLGHTVGTGGEGEVIHAHVLAQGAWQEVAIKVLHRGTDNEAEFDARTAEWHEQLKLVQFLAHQGVVRMREQFVGAPPHYEDDANRPGRSLYLAMNWAPGEPMSTWLVSNPSASYGERARIVVQVGGALAYLHSGADTSGQPILHGDLKPGNVIVAPGGGIQIVDFGMARGESHEGRRGMSGGYAAPEVRDGHPISKASDMYALGAITYTLFVGASPPDFNAATYNQAVLRQALDASPLVGGQPEIINHILWAMAANPADRPVDVGAWAGGLSSRTSSVIESATLPPAAPAAVAAPVAPAWSEPAPPRHTGLKVAVAVLAFIAVAGAGMWFASARSSSSDLAAGSGAPETTTTLGTSTTAEPTTTTEKPATTTTSKPSTTTTAKATTTTTAKPVPTTPPPMPATLDDLRIGGSGATKAKVNGIMYLDAFVGYHGCTSKWSSDFDLSRGYTSLTGTVGITDDSVADRPVRGRIILDGAVLLERDLVLGQSEPFTVDVTNGLRLRFETEVFERECRGDLNFAFGDPKLTK